MDDRLVAGGIHLEYGSIPMRPAVRSCAIQVAGCILNYSCRGIPSVAHPAETVQHGLSAAGVELEDGSAAIEVDVASRASAAEKGGSVEIPGRISGHSSLGPTPVRKGATAVKWVKLSEGLCRRRSNQKQNRHKRQKPNKKRANLAAFA